MAILVQSKVTNFVARKSIRETWKRDCEASDFCSCIFVTGRPITDEAANKKLEEEALVHKDIVQADIADTYHNLTLKTMFSIQ